MRYPLFLNEQVLQGRFDPGELSCKPFDQKDCPDCLKFEDFEAKLTGHHFLAGIFFGF
jgi:hypothetical protein